jgi:hypothetical protein
MMYAEQEGSTSSDPSRPRRFELGTFRSPLTYFDHGVRVDSALLIQPTQLYIYRLVKRCCA